MSIPKQSDVKHNVILMTKNIFFRPVGWLLMRLFTLPLLFILIGILSFPIDILLYRDSNLFGSSIESIFGEKIWGQIGVYVFNTGGEVDPAIPVLVNSFVAVILLLVELTYLAIYKKIAPFRHFTFALKTVLLGLAVVSTGLLSILVLPIQNALSVLGGLIVIVILIYSWMIVEYGVLLIISYIGGKESHEQLWTIPGFIACMKLIFMRKPLNPFPIKLKS